MTIKIRSREPLQTLLPTGTSRSQAQSTSSAVIEGSIYTDVTDTNHLLHEQALAPTVMHRVGAAKPTAADNDTNPQSQQIVHFLLIYKSSNISLFDTNIVYT
jgi:hypothetical protein